MDPWATQRSVVQSSALAVPGRLIPNTKLVMTAIAILILAPNEGVSAAADYTGGIGATL